MQHKAFIATLAVLTLITTLQLAFTSPASPNKQKPLKALVVPIRQTVDFGLSAFIKRAVEKAKEDNTDFLILDINTYGGELDPAFKITNTMLEAASHTQTIAFVNEKAISAGALIALSCQHIVMSPNSTIGDCAPIMMGKDGAKILGEKIQSPLRAEFRKLAAENNYPELLAQAMVTKEMAVYQVEFKNGTTRFMTSSDLEDSKAHTPASDIVSRKTIVEKDQLLTMHAKEAVSLGFAKAIVPDVQALDQIFNITKTQTLQQNWDETFARYINMISPILMMLGFLGIWIELKTPGFGLPGILGISSIILVLAAKYAIGLSSYTDIVLIMLGLVLLGVEIFVLPGFGIAGFAGISLIIAGLYLSSVDFVIPQHSWQFASVKRWLLELLFSAGTAVVAGGIIARYLPRNSLFQHIAVLQKEEKTEDGFTSPGPEKIKSGTPAIAYTMLRPAGKIKCEGKILDATTHGEFIPANTPVVITAIEGNKIIVRQT